MYNAVYTAVYQYLQRQRINKEAGERPRTRHRRAAAATTPRGSPSSPHLRVLAASAGLAHSGVVAAKRFLLALMGETAWKPVDVRCCPVSSSLPRARLALARTHAWRTARGFASNGA